MRGAVSLAMGVLIVGACLPRESASGIDLEAPARATKGLGLYHTVVIEVTDEEEPDVYDAPTEAALHGTTLLVAAPSLPTGYGVLFFDLSSGDAVETFRVEGINPGSPHWGNKVAVHGDHAVVVAGLDARVYKRINGEWTHFVTIVEPPNEAQIDTPSAWASSVAIDAERVYVGAASGEAVVDGEHWIPGTIHIFPITESGVGPPVLLLHAQPTPWQGFGCGTLARGNRLFVLSQSSYYASPSLLDVFEFNGAEPELVWSGSAMQAHYAELQWTFAASDDLVVVSCQSCGGGSDVQGLTFVRRDVSGAWSDANLISATTLGVTWTRGVGAINRDVILVVGGNNGDTETFARFFDISSGSAVEIARIPFPGEFSWNSTVRDGYLIQRALGALRLSRIDLSIGQSCTVDSDCTQGFCRDSVCCDSACGDGDPDDCLACSVAMGAAVDGTCAPTTGFLCDDGDACTDSDTCVEGACTGDLASCDDENPCTVDACDVSLGCVFVQLDDGFECEDGDSCTSSDVCVEGACLGVVIACEDSNPCTSDSCDGSNGCAHSPLSDGSPCATGCIASGTCVDGVCASADALCDDENPCTVDACANDACEHVNVDDDTPCPGGSCFDGKCVPTTALDAGSSSTDAGPVTPPTCTCDSSSSSPTDLSALIAALLTCLRRRSTQTIAHEGRAR